MALSPLVFSKRSGTERNRVRLVCGAVGASPAPHTVLISCSLLDVWLLPVGIMRSECINLVFIYVP